MPAEKWQKPLRGVIFGCTPKTPEAGEVLTIGDLKAVTWCVLKTSSSGSWMLIFAGLRNASLVPGGASNIPRIDLYRNTTVGLADFTVNLAENVNPRLGTVDYTVPDVEPGSYFVTSTYPLEKLP